jgi:site-specific DNA recombinase
VQDLVTRPFYAGRIVYEGETFPGQHERLIEPAAFDRIRGDRDLGRGRHVKGRPAKRHALQGLAECAECGRRMNSFTSSYKRKDGSRQRLYQCPGYTECNETCSAKPVDARVVDAAVIDALDKLLARRGAARPTQTARRLREPRPWSRRPGAV